jgi:inosine-uridine nucleoside N-ribohydrolase/formylmethanofuran dehydrogenase subunit E
MKRVLAFLALSLIFRVSWSQPMPARINHSVIIDTDGAIDDLRAISYLLSRPEITIKAVLLSDGSLTPGEGAKKVASLLHEFGADSIPVACGPELKGVNPPWRQFNMGISWGSSVINPERVSSPSDCIAKCLDNSDETIILVCLGPLTNVAQFVQGNKNLLHAIERIVWYNESVKPLKGFNYDCDRESVETVLRSGVRTDVISNLGMSGALFDSAMYNLCRDSGTRLSKVLSYVFNQKGVNDKMRQNHFRFADDLAALYITNPELFGINTVTDRLNVRYNKEYDLPGVREAMCDMIRGSYLAGRNIVFSRFPAEREQFRYDVRPIIDSAISRYGYEEWKANVMTDEFHGHLGVFSIVGAKMGIRAREIFGVGPDMLNAVTYAGTKPPYSCLNDGIQVSTGATLGMGTIHLANDTITRPSAVFTYRGRSVKLSLKKEYLDKVDADISEGILKFGLMDDGYWKLIRRNALKYWLEWDRNKIFDVEEITSK